jgi:cobalt-zinc-cadmium efflux system membrane fusion protein
MIRNNVSRALSGVALALATAACGSHAQSEAAAAADHPFHVGDPLELDAKMLASVKVEAVDEHTMRAPLTVVGRVQFDEDRVARVLVPVAGQVSDLSLKVGDAVKRGQALFQLNSREAASAVGEHLEAHRDLDLAEKTATMTEDLFQHEAASRIALQQTQNDLAKAKARVARTEEALRVLGLIDDHGASRFNGRVPIVSPIGGVVIERKVTDGQFVQSDSTPAVTVADLSTVWVVGDLFERDLHLASVGLTATVTTPAYPGEAFKARVSYISDTIDPATRTAKVRVSVVNPGVRLKPEMFASIALDVSSDERQTTLPARATFMEGGRTFVFVEVAPGRFVRRAVEVASGEGDERRVTSGLKAGERVVVDGAVLLRQEEEQRAS